MKYLKKYLKNYSPIIFGTIIGLLSYCKLDLSKFSLSEIVFDKTVDFSGILFGFLITIYAIITQSDSDGIKLLKEENEYNTLLNYNKRVILSSVILCIYSLLLLILKNYEFYICEKKNQNILMSIYLFALWIFIHLTYKFLHTFFKVTRYNSDKV